ncbi:MAG: DUF2791 family P-loop domain-containing protein [Bacteroidetes bacterium]|nr:DUF2791 family P-loop domain-containing protein [Bacteroidota bacterium]
MTHRKLTVSLDEIKRMVFGYDFAHVLSKYWLGYEGDEELVEKSLKWLRGEYHTKTEAKQDLKVRAVINDENWFDFIKILSKFVTYVGYKGLLIFFDECVYLTRVNHTMSRRNNYERILAIFNETMQGKTSHIGVFFGGTPYFSKAFDLVNLASPTNYKNGWLPSNKIYSRWGLVSDALNEKYAAFRSAIFDYHYGIDIFAQNKEVGQAKIVELIDVLYDLYERTGLVKSVFIQTFFNAKYGEITDHLIGYSDQTIFTKLKKIDPSHAGRYDLSTP